MISSDYFGNGQGCRHVDDVLHACAPIKPCNRNNVLVHDFKSVRVCGSSATVSYHPLSSNNPLTIYLMYQRTTRADMDKDRKAFEHKINMESDAVNTEVELRTRELLRLRDEKQQEQEMVETRQVCGGILNYVGGARFRMSTVSSRT